MPTGKQNSIAKIEIMKVRARPPHSLVGIFSKLKFPPDRRDIKIKGKTNSKKIIKFFIMDYSKIILTKVMTSSTLITPSPLSSPALNCSSVGVSPRIILTIVMTSKTLIC